MKKPQKATLTLLLLGFMIVGTPHAHAQKFTVLYNFAGPPDGGLPQASLIDEHGVLYGTTYVGGTGPCATEGVTVGCGTIFKVSGKKETQLYSFRGQPDGALPVGNLLQDKSGNLYGTTTEGGAYGYGAIFKLSGNKETILYSFKGVPDGAGPTGGLLRDAAGNFYGTTGNGGANPGNGGNPAGVGTVFRLDAKGRETVLYSFCSAMNCTDGDYPQDYGLVMDTSGNLYGTTGAGGSGCSGGLGCGTVFKLDKSGRESVLYSFCTEPGCLDGKYPTGGLVMDAAGNLYGTTQQGGDGQGVEGVVFKLDTNGNEWVLHTFCSESGCADGETPLAGPIMDGDGNLYGTTLEGGDGGGAVFELDAAGIFTVLHAFGGLPGPMQPIGGLVMNAKGILYGTTYQGGSGNCLIYDGCGVVFKIKP